jgi:membrane dipeptidase
VKEDPPEKVAAMEALRQEMGLGEGYAGWRTMSDEQRAQFRAGMQEIQERWPVTVADFVDHIDHAVALIGIDHVGISSDFDGGGGIQGWNDASQALNVTVELVRRGYSEEEIRKLWGGNLLRVWREVERVAAEMQGVGTTG